LRTVAFVPCMSPPNGVRRRLPPATSSDVADGRRTSHFGSSALPENSSGGGWYCYTAVPWIFTYRIPEWTEQQIEAHRSRIRKFLW
jgi:hypothetical protein